MIPVAWTDTNDHKQSAIITLSISSIKRWLHAAPVHEGLQVHLLGEVQVPWLHENEHCAKRKRALFESKTSRSMSERTIAWSRSSEQESMTSTDICPDTDDWRSKTSQGEQESVSAHTLVTKASRPPGIACALVV